MTPEQVPYYLVARELVASWMRDPRTRGRRDVAGLARRLRLG